MKSAQATKCQANLLAENRHFLFIREELCNTKQGTLMRNSHIHI